MFLISTNGHYKRRCKYANNVLILCPCELHFFLEKQVLRIDKKGGSKLQKSLKYNFERAVTNTNLRLGY